MPDLTVVMPVWDGYAGRPLSEALESLRGQTPQPRIVLVDNASEPAVPAIDGTEVVRTPERLSVGAARKLGLLRSTTEWTLFWDADDIMLPGTLEALAGATRDHPDVVAVATAIVDGATGTAHHWPRGWTHRLARRPLCFALVNAVSSLYPSIGALVRTRAAVEAGGHPDTNGGDDWALGVSLAFRGRVVLLSHPGRLYRRHADSLSARWRAVPDISSHAALVRRQLRQDDGVPQWVRRSTWALGALQWAVILVARPVSRATPARRRAQRRMP